MPAEEHDDDTPTPANVTVAIAAGVLPLPFLAVYAVIFIAHGSVRPVNPPDITTTKGGELVAGLLALLILIVFSMSVYWFLHGRWPWLFVLGQLATLGTCIWLIVDRTTGAIAVPVVLAVTSLIALAAVLYPVTHRFITRTQVGAS